MNSIKHWIFKIIIGMVIILFGDYTTNNVGNETAFHIGYFIGIMVFASMLLYDSILSKFKEKSK